MSEQANVGMQGHPGQAAAPICKRCHQVIGSPYGCQCPPDPLDAFMNTVRAYVGDIPQLGAWRGILEAEFAKARLEEAKWWCARRGIIAHQTRISPCGCVECERIVALEQRTGEKKSLSSNPKEEHARSST